MIRYLYGRFIDAKKKYGFANPVIFYGLRDEEAQCIDLRERLKQDPHKLIFLPYNPG